MGFTFKDINGEIYELPYEANADYIEISCKRNNDEEEILYHVMMDGKVISVTKETYLAVEIYKNALR